ncbi:MAG: type II toxin-antitoxin system RelE/ParE family toxin [Aequorivita sp.]
MAYILELKEEANLEITEAYLYYEENRKGLGEEFLEHLDLYFDRITTHPKHFPQKRKPYREAFIKRFPFLLIYEITKERVIVYSVFNTWQNPKKRHK